MKKSFPLGTILTVTTGRLLTSPKNGGNGIEDLYEVLAYMTGESPYTHTLGRFSEECKPWLLRWFPELQKASEPEHIARLDAVLKNAHSDSVASAVKTWLMYLQKNLGLKDSYEVEQIPLDDHERKNPLDEMIAIRGTDEGIVPIVINKPPPQ